ncbi:diguanylate cyclase [Pelovirga terrestris]|uniref:diguanylate cyclase n=1 Tax=Pelovirga terrestris TaxID=2771352 RepID=A0A8J6UHN4_9BACT|nr:sensor domain-containing diguanylate cyclase [Pelovirga terrestris]
MRWLNEKIWRKPKASTTEVDADILTLPFAAEHQCDLLISPEHFLLIRQFHQDVLNQLDMLGTFLQSASVVLLWPTPGYQLRVFASNDRTHQIQVNAFAAGSGLLGVLKERTEFALAPYPASAPALPYYPDAPHPGSFYACRIGSDPTLEKNASSAPLLCVDRPSREPWSKVEIAMIKRTGEQIATSLNLHGELLLADFERKVLQQSFNGLKVLNSSLTLDSVYRAAAAALRMIVAADLIGFGKICGDMVELQHLDGDGSFSTDPQRYPLDDSLIGQAVKYRCILPDGGENKQRTPVINGLPLFDNFSSILAIPLVQDRLPVSGILLIAGRKNGLFSRRCRDLIEMISAQVAIKVELAGSHEQINQLTVTDGLTGIANRRAFERALEVMHQRALRRESAFSLIICDIDLFKKINDTCGHPFGDQVIRQVAAEMKAVVRSGDLAARIGGEEFAVLLEDTDSKGAAEVAERLRDRVEKKQLRHQGVLWPVTISIGVAAFPGDTGDTEKLINYADQALYRAKESGRNRTVVWSDAIRGS